MKQTPHFDILEHRKFGIRDSLSYAVGDIGCSMSYALKSTMAVFWTQFMGLKLWYSLLLILVQLWNAIGDPLIGTLIDADRRTYKRNKFFVYMTIGSVGLLVGSAISFIPAPNAPLWVQGIIFVAGYMIWDAFYTVTNVPYGSLLPLISRDPADRASLSAWRSIGSLVGNMVPALILPFVLYDERNNLIGERVFIAALIMGTIGFFAFQYMIHTTVVRESCERVSTEKPKRNILLAMRGFLKNRAAVGVTIAVMGMFLSVNGSALAVTVLFQSYFDNIDASGIVQVIAMLPVLLFAPMARRTVVRFGKKEVAVFGACISIAACVLMLVLPITPDRTGMLLYVLCQFLNNLGVGIFSTVSWALMGDAVDYHEWKTKKREEGIVFSMHSFFRKLAQGLGPALVLVIMTLLGYIGENKGAQTDEVALRMRFLVAALYLFGALLQGFGLAFIYPINKKKLTQMNEALGRKN